MRPVPRVWFVATSTVALATAVLCAQAPPSSPQTFRGGVDLIRIDVTVLDRNRNPVRGLGAPDFTVVENGREQRIVAVTEVDAAAEDQVPSAWMRYAERDVTNNDLADELADGQAVGIVMDDDNVPFDDSAIVVATRELARFVVNSLRPSDMAAVVFPVGAGRTQDFTGNRTALLEAIDRFEPAVPDALSEMYRTLPPQGRIQGDIRRYSPALARDPCLQNEPLLPTLRAVTARLASIPNRRKTLLLLSTGSPVRFTSGGSRCQAIWYEEMRQTFRLAQRSNVNIHGIDPAGAGGMEAHLRAPRIRNGRMVLPADSFAAHQAAERLRDFLEVVADQTGGRAVTASVDVEGDTARILHEASSYYLIGYQTTNAEPDGKFRRVEVKVRDRALTVRAKNGYWAPDEDSVTAENARRRETPTANELNLAGMTMPTELGLRAVAHPVALRPDGSVDVAAVLTVHVPAPREDATEKLTIVRSVTDLDGAAGQPVREILTPAIESAAGGATWYDTFAHFSLGSGRYEVRFNAQSELADAGASIYVDLEIPDFGRSPIGAPRLVIGTPVPAGRTNPFAAVLPIVPTTARDFTADDEITALLRVFQGGDGTVQPVSIATKILGADDVDPVESSATLPAGAFADTRAADFRMRLPLADLPPGMHLLSVTASIPAGRSIRRDVVFRRR